MEVDPEFLSPRTPPPENNGDVEDGKDEQHDDSIEDNLSNSGGKGRRKHRRSKGKKRKQKTSLLITNEDGTDFNPGNAAANVKQSKIQLRPTNNPLINAPKNSTQFIIDDHENSNLFWHFDAQEEGEGAGDAEVGQLEGGGVLPGQIFGAADNERFSPDDESFWTEYSERDFEVVYETAHQEEIFGWQRDKILREIAAMEARQKQLIEMLAAVDPVVYLEKLQQELLSLQEVNRELKLVNIAEKLHRREREERDGREDSDSDSRLPDSTSQEGETRDVEDEDDEGGCMSGCCLKDPCDTSCQLNQDQNLADVEEEEEDSVHQDNVMEENVPEVNVLEDIIEQDKVIMDIQSEENLLKDKVNEDTIKQDSVTVTHDNIPVVSSVSQDNSPEDSVVNYLIISQDS